MNKPNRIAILSGGSSAEAEVSRSSAEQIGNALATNHEVKIFELESGLTEQILGYEPDVVFPALHGSPGEDGTVQGYLEILEIPYVGSGVHGSALAMDKHAAKQIFKDGGLPVLDHLLIKNDKNRPDASAIQARLGPNVVIKPISEGSAIGVTRVTHGDDLNRLLAQSLNEHDGLLIEPYFQGKEITVGVLDLFDQPIMPLPVVEILLSKDEWYNFENRYKEGASTHRIPPDGMTHTFILKLQEIALSAHKLLNLSDLSRTDFLVNDAGEVALLEVNTIPGMTPTSLYPDAASAIGIDFPLLVRKLVQSAWDRKKAGNEPALNFNQNTN